MSRRHDHRRSVNPCRRALAALLVGPMSVVGCASAPRPLSTEQRIAQAERYRSQLEEDETENTDPQESDELAGAVAEYRRSPTAVTPGMEQGNNAFKVVDGVTQYRVGAGDVLRVTSYVGPEEPRQSQLRVRADGTILVTRFQIGEVSVAGLSPSEVAETIAERYREYAEGVFIDVEVVEHRAWMATLLGELELGGSGEHPLEGRTTVVEFIYDNGGPTDAANLADVQLIRGDQQRSLDLLAAMLRGRDDLNPVLDAGDVVFVPSRTASGGRVFVFGEVARPGDVAYTEGLRFMDAIAQAGAFTSLAALESAYVTRYDEGGPRVIDVNVEQLMAGAGRDLNVELRQGDIITVPRKTEVSRLLRDILAVSTLIISVLTIIQVR